MGTIEVFDDDFGKENFIGSYTFPLKQAIKETDKEASWNNLTGCKTGKISFSTFYSPDYHQDEEKDEEKEEEIKDTVPDSFINDIYTSEGRQASHTEGEKSDEKHDVEEEVAEDKMDDSTKEIETQRDELLLDKKSSMKSEPESKP